MKNVNILLGGPISEYPKNLISNIESISGDWVSADHGTLYLLNKNIIPKFAVGDFDSSSVSEFDKYKRNIQNIIKVPSEKDYTDSQLALKVVMKNFTYDEIHIYGATGGRLDHLLVNLFLGANDKFTKIIENVKIIDNKNYLEFLNPGHHLIKKIPNMKYIGFINVGPVKNLNLINSKYKLNNFTTDVSTSWASNEFVDKTIELKFDDGSIISVQSKD